MSSSIHPDRSFEFYFPDLDTLLLVEEAEDRVVIRASRNSFSEQRKTFFLHELAAEGFIPDRYQWVSNFEANWSLVSWFVDASWVRVHESNTARTRKFMVRLLLSAAFCWLGMMAACLFGWI